eukprot:SAG11_NODE_43_length_20795_cov_11.860456_11_plen_79_part_00
MAAGGGWRPATGADNGTPQRGERQRLLRTVRTQQPHVVQRAHQSLSCYNVQLIDIIGIALQSRSSVSKMTLKLHTVSM